MNGAGEISEEFSISRNCCYGKVAAKERLSEGRFWQLDP